MEITVELLETNGPLAVFKGKGECEGQATVSARLVLVRYNLRDRDPALQATDERLIQHYRGLYGLIGPGPLTSKVP